MNFLDSLEPAERQAFISVADERTFARGARLMREGDPANYVIVILGGWTQITVNENGSERVIIERGPGQLVGERGALQVNVRSATVTALTLVRALVMDTEDFASFIDAHPRVLTVVEDQIYDRLTRDSLPDTTGNRLRASVRPVPARRPAGTGPGRRLAGENCTVLLTDVVGFGALTRNDGDRLIIRRASRDITRAALGPAWDECIAEDRGDGLLIVVPPHVPTANVMTLLHRRLPAELRQHNRTYGEPVRIKLRVAANVGPVISDAVGMSGEAIIRVARLIEAPALKDAMAATGATLGIITSEFVYETAIRHSPEFIGVDEYNFVEVNVKESAIAGWMQLIDPLPPESRLRDPLMPLA